MGYTITPDFIAGVPKSAYADGIGAYRFVVSHCTDSANRSGGDTPEREIIYEDGHWQSAFVHFFVGVENKQPIIRQAADTRYKAWGAGSIANQYGVHIELCMYDDPYFFNMAYDAYVWLIAKLLADRKLSIAKAGKRGDGTPSGTVWSHADISRLYPGTTDHQDPIDYLRAHGISWDNHVARVQRVWQSMVNPAPVVVPAPKTDVSSTVDDKRRKKPMEPWLQETLIKSITELGAKGKIGQPDFWIKKVKDGDDVAPLAIILINNLK